MDYDIKKFDIEYKLPTIQYDLTDLKKQIEQVKEQYGNLVVGENDIPKAKEIRANLNKLNKEMSRKRIDLVREIKEPISQFENEIKVLEVDIKETSEKINEQIKDYEEKEKKDKLDLIVKSDLWQDYMIFDEKWLNKTYKLEEIEYELKQQEQRFSNNALAIATTCQNLKLDSEKYIDLLKKNTPINEILQQITSDRELLNKHSNIEKVEIKEDVNETVDDVKNETILSYKLEIFGTITQLKALRQFIDDNGMTYEKVID